MSDLYWIFTLSNFQVFPGDIMSKSEGEIKLIRIFLHKAMKDHNLPIRLYNMNTEPKKGGTNG